MGECLVVCGTASGWMLGGLCGVISGWMLDVQWRNLPPLIIISGWAVEFVVVVLSCYYPTLLLPDWGRSFSSCCIRSPTRLRCTRLLLHKATAGLRTGRQQPQHDKRPLPPTECILLFGFKNLQQDSAQHMHDIRIRTRC